jgi:hypothetical protein
MPTGRTLVRDTDYESTKPRFVNPSAFLAGSRGGGEVSFPSIRVSKDTFELPARHYVASSRNAILSEIDTRPPRCLTEAKHRPRGLLSFRCGELSVAVGLTNAHLWAYVFA